MRKGFAIALALVLLITAGCSKKEQPVQPTVPETAAPAQTVPETTAPKATGEATVPETAPQPKLVSATVQGDGIPAVVCILNRGDSVEVTGTPDETTATVKTGAGTGSMELRLLRFAGEAQPEPWTGYARWNTGLYETYELSGKAVATLKTNTRVTVLEELGSCCMVTVNGKTGYVAKGQVSRWPIQTGSGSSGSGGKDGGDIALSYCGKVQLLSAVSKTGPADVLADGVKVILKYYNLGDTVQLIAEEGLVPELAGYLPILVEGQYAYIPQGWVLKDGEAAFESWSGFAGSGCRLYDNYLLSGDPVRPVYGNTAITVLWTAGEVSLIQVGSTIGYASTDTLRTTRLPSTSGGSSDGGGGSEWTPPAM